MEILKSEQYINEKLNIQPVTKERMKNLMSNQTIMDDDVKLFIEQWSMKFNPSTQRYDCEYNITVPHELVRDDRKGFKLMFGMVKGFDCRGLGLLSLYGSPTKAFGNFDCSDNEL